jgi:hypothetical protein
MENDCVYTEVKTECGYTEDQIVCLAEGYRRMVAKVARYVWLKLPAHTRVWVSIEDLVEDGMAWVMVNGIPKWRKKRATLSTFLHTGVKNWLHDNYLLHHYCKRRCEYGTVSLDGLSLIGVDDFKYEIEVRVPALVDNHSAEDTVIDCWVVSMMVKIFKQATELLRRELEKWFFGADRLYLQQRWGVLTDTQLEFALARQEFLGLAEPQGLGYQECEHLLSDRKCLAELKFAVCHL